MLGGPCADFLRGVAFWSIRSSSLLRWFCVTGAALHMTWHHFFVARAVSTLDRWNGKIARRIGHEAVSFALNFPFLKAFSQNSRRNWKKTCVSKRVAKSQFWFLGSCLHIHATWLDHASDMYGVHAASVVILFSRPGTKRAEELQGQPRVLKGWRKRWELQRRQRLLQRLEELRWKLLRQRLEELGEEVEDEAEDRKEQP